MHKITWTLALAALLALGTNAGAAEWPHDVYSGLDCRKDVNDEGVWEPLDNHGLRWNFSRDRALYSCPLSLRADYDCDYFQVTVHVSDGNAAEDVRCEIQEHDLSGEFAEILSDDPVATRSSSGEGLQTIGLPFIHRDTDEHHALVCTLPPADGPLSDDDVSALVKYEVLQVCSD